MRIEIVNTGTELLLGRVLNTHAAYFGRELFKLGLRVQRQVTVPDGAEIRSALTEAFPRSDVVLVTGGLGPTSDDMTREVVADLLHRDLFIDEGILSTIHEMFRERGLEQNPQNDRQAMVLQGAIVLPNAFGTAPGMYLPPDRKVGSPHLFLLPGPPRELEPMYQRQVMPLLKEILQEMHESAPVWRNFRIFGVGESNLASVLDPLLSRMSGLELGYCAQLGEVDLRLIGEADSVEAFSTVVRREFYAQIVVENEDPIEKVVVNLLAEKGETVSTAESCTGGLIASTITDVPGSSSVFHRGYVVYSNEAKREMLGVGKEPLDTHGAVSDEVVREMAEGCLKNSGAHHAIAVSGIAGPGGGSPEKPVGTVYVALATAGMETYSARYFFPVDRRSFKLRVVRLTLDLLRRRLRGIELTDR